MPSTFLSLVNKINRRMNEVELTSSNFASANGFYNTAKDAVNDSIRRINQNQYQWPFNYVSQNDTLVAGQVRYAFQSDVKHVDFDSFRIQRDDTIGNDTRRLRRIDYEEYLTFGLDAEYNTTDTSIREIPRYVFQAQNQEYGVYPAPDEAYTLTYEYFSLPTDLSSFSDTPTLPEQFDHIITNGALQYVYDFRGDGETAMRYGQLFIDQIGEMKEIYNTRQSHMKDTRVNLNQSPLQGKVI